MVQPQKIGIVIPIYKEIPTSNELKALEQCCCVLNRYPITTISPSTLSLENYTVVFERYKIHHIPIHFECEYFSSVRGYNKLMLSKFFYESFTEFDNILIYQLDAFVFRDELTEWCEKEYDYIGAPWFEGYKTYEEGRKLYKVGNGGFSLRKVSAFLATFDKPMPFAILPFYLKNIRMKGAFSMIIKLAKLLLSILFTKKNVDYCLANLTDDRINEDCFWSDGLSSTCLTLKVPDVDTAAHFCFEKSPSHLFALIGNKLPFGCHAWEKYEPEFWDSIINIKT